MSGKYYTITVKYGGKILSKVLFSKWDIRIDGTFYKLAFCALLLYIWNIFPLIIVIFLVLISVGHINRSIKTLLCIFWSQQWGRSYYGLWEFPEVITIPQWLLLLLSRFSRVRLCATPQMAAYQAPPSLGFSRQEDWSGLPFPSPMHESEKWKWSRSVVSNPQWPHGLQPTRLLCPWDFPGKSTGVGCHRLQSISSLLGSPCFLRHL